MVRPNLPPALAHLNREVRSLLTAAVDSGLTTRTAVMRTARVDWTTINDLLGGRDLTRRDALVRLRNAVAPVAVGLVTPGVGPVMTGADAPSSSDPEPDPVWASIERKLEAEFDSCSLLPTTLRTAADAIPEAVAAVRPEHVALFRTDDWFRRVVRAGAGTAAFGPLRRGRRPIRVSAPVIELGSIAALLKVRDDWGVEVEIVTLAANGAEQMRRVNRDGPSAEIDYGVFGVAASALAIEGGSQAAMFRLVCPIHQIRQCVLARSPWLNDLRKVYVCEGGFAVMQSAAPEGVVDGALPAKVQRAPLTGVTCPLAAGGKVNSGEGVIAYEPVASTLRGSGLMTVKGTEFSIYIGLFAHRRHLARRRPGGPAELFAAAFAAAYRDLQADRPLARRLLRGAGPAILAAYAAAAGLPFAVANGEHARPGAEPPGLAR
ncbi:MAG: hypothetical protein K2X87_11065 [Gemmataceae bacterium]|nr:hypothetical protein [Gemmataceae bacterium]